MMSNLELDVWLMADQLLVGWLYNAMTPEVAAQVMRHDDAKCIIGINPIIFWYPIKIPIGPQPTNATTI